PDSDCCTRFAAEHADEVLFFAYLQWLAHEQLQAAQQLAQELGLAIG
ncbi:MAG: 4-alpha-glucanotransferase, partial [Candidatus Competibacteraceae bacterium]|nr:4-alpha-glucanotransferase [Candidatus Competibacteraceae bacterium]